MRGETREVGMRGETRMRAMCQMTRVMLISPRLGGIRDDRCEDGGPGGDFDAGIEWARGRGHRPRSYAFRPRDWMQA